MNVTCKTLAGGFFSGRFFLAFFLKRRAAGLRFAPRLARSERHKMPMHKSFSMKIASVFKAQFSFHAI